MDINVNQYKAVQLKAWCAALGLPSGGTKAEMALRLNAVDVAARGAPPALVPVQEQMANNEDDGEEEQTDNENEEEVSNHEPSEDTLSVYSGDAHSNIDDIEAELKLVQRERDLLKQKISLLEKNAGTNRGNTADISNMAAYSGAGDTIPLNIIKDMIPEYDGGSHFHFWEAQVLNLMKTYKVNQNTMRALITIKLSGKALKWLHSNLACATCNFEELLILMKSAFGLREHKLMRRKNFEERKWVSGETFSEYYHEKTIMATGLNIEKEDMIDYIIEGIPSKHLREQAQLQCFENETHLLKAFAKIGWSSDENNFKKKPEVSKAVRCFNCNALGHYATACLKPKRQYGACYGCGKTDHQVINCPDRKMPANRPESNEYLVRVLRNILHFRKYDLKSAADRQAQSNLFNLLVQGLVRSEKLYTVWQKTLASLPAEDFRSCDFIMLLVLIHIKEENSLYLENILRRRIKLEHISIDILEEVKSKYAPVLELYLEPLMQIQHDFLREKHKSVSDFSRGSYSILFTVCNSLQKEILKRLLELSCDKSSQNLTHLSLELLLDLKVKYPKEVHNWGTMLMPLLDRLSEMTLSQTRLVMELLCSIAYPPPGLVENSTLQDQIDMLMTKQLINRDDFVKKQGIVGSVQLVDCIARIEEHDLLLDTCNTSFNSVSALPDGRGKTAAEYVVRIHSSTDKCPESLALFYDELASICTSSGRELNMDIPFVVWLCELMTYYFQNNFVAEHTPMKIHDIELTYQKCINSPSDMNTEDPELPSIAINIAELVLNPPDDAASSVLVLAPLFNCVRALHLLRYEKSLELINALLGCAIVLPTFFDEADPDKIFTTFDGRVQRQLMDIYFHCANWLRETISSFATQREKMIQKKVLQRLVDLIEIEGKIKNLLRYAPSDYVPPLCDFVTAKANTNNSRGRPAANVKPMRVAKRVMPNANQTEMEINNETNINETMGLGLSLLQRRNNKSSNKNKANFDALYGAKEIYRQMGSEVMLLLETKLYVDYPLPMAEIGEQIGLLEYRFILTDLVVKLESITGIERFHSEQTLQHINNPQYFMHDVCNFLHIIFKNMEKIGTAIGDKLIEVEHIYSHAHLFSDHFSYLKVCFELCFRLFAAYFSWSEFNDASKVDLLRRSLLSIMPQNKKRELGDKSTALIAAAVFNNCLKYEAAIVDLKTAMHLYHLVGTLKRHASNDLDAKKVLDQREQEIRSLCKSLLCRKWFGYNAVLEKGAACNIYLDELVRGFLRNSNFKRQREIMNIVIEECTRLNGKDASMSSFPNIKKANFPLIFRGLCEVLIYRLQEEITATNVSAKEDQLQIWEKSCDLLNSLLDIMNAVDLPRNFQLFVKHSHIYLKLILQHGLSVFELHLRRNPDRVCELLKSLQVSTRFLHNICCQSKASKNNIIAQIPLLRETVENLVFRVKALLAANKCASVFWMGNLKNKDLHGEIILSQSVSLSAQTNDNSDEEIPEDDVSVDETVIGQDERASRKSSSSVLTAMDSGGSKSTSRSKCF